MIRQLAIALAALSLPAAHAVEKVKVLIVTGQNNHNWVRSTPVIRGLLEETGRFDVTVTTTPTKEAPKDAWQDWRPAFEKFEVVVSDYNGKEWPEPIKAEFVDYVHGGGRVALVHGDLWPGNVLLGSRGRLGVIDWDQASFHDAALHDALHLTLHPVRMERRVDLGLLIRSLLVSRDDDPVLSAALARTEVGKFLQDTGITERDALIWYWLRHVDRMTREPGHATNPRWISSNVVAVGTTIHQGRRTT